MERYWRAKQPAEMSAEEWEGLCDRCGKCCLNKLADESSDDLVFFTAVACRYLDLEKSVCKVYSNRYEFVPDCLEVTPDIKPAWLPPSCAYRRLLEGRDLPHWHPLLAGGREKMDRLGLSVRGRAISEGPGVEPEAYMVEWPMFDLD